MRNPYTCHLPVAGPTPDANGWLPIESAPRDGSWFLGFVCHQAEVVSWFPGVEDVADWEPCWQNRDGMLRYAVVTHWQPLPTAPLGNGGELG